MEVVIVNFHAKPRPQNVDGLDKKRTHAKAFISVVRTNC